MGAAGRAQSGTRMHRPRRGSTLREDARKSGQSKGEERDPGLAQCSSRVSLCIFVRADLERSVLQIAHEWKSTVRATRARDGGGGGSMTAKGSFVRRHHGGRRPLQ
jgi:hypothetical protein